MTPFYADDSVTLYHGDYRPCPWFVAAGRGLTWSRREITARRLAQDVLDFGASV